MHIIDHQAPQTSFIFTLTQTLAASHPDIGRISPRHWPHLTEVITVYAIAAITTLPRPPRLNQAIPNVLMQMVL
ncbi:hypothetical protein Pmani_006844 [Petrolisthes manimaculis]|uniref:Uncharacterized protein n=1 Tax=Petrolisthes manimaculis TaxID=1843537 RepID=A0AAE1QC30_9EUCA|nr:hypothetical protein Pmani_006844 [Petrolisthes manimaculis]